MSLSALPPATRVAGRYLLDRELARGGMGAVWLARDERLGRDVAVKLMTIDGDSAEMQTRFEREALAVAKLSSAHVVEVYDYGVHHALPFIVMELLRGEALSDRLRRVKRFSVGDSAHLFGQICRGLRAAHDAGLVHRDIKPSNVFLARRDEVEMAVLIDFGVVKAIDPIEGSSTDQTTTGALVGTPQYMSPEQARAVREIDHRSDLWSAAVIAFRLLTGKSPFRGGSLGDVVLRICSDAIPSATKANPALPPTIEGFFERAFERDRDRRYQTVEEMLAAFRTTLGLDPVDPSWSGVRAADVSVARALASSPSWSRDDPPPSSAQPTAIYEEGRGHDTRVDGESLSISVDIDDATTTENDAEIPAPPPPATAILTPATAVPSEDSTVGGTASGLSPLYAGAAGRMKWYVAAAAVTLTAAVAVGLGASGSEPVALLAPFPPLANGLPPPPPAPSADAGEDLHDAPSGTEPKPTPSPKPSATKKPAGRPRTPVRRPPVRPPPAPRTDRPDWGL